MNRFLACTVLVILLGILKESSGQLSAGCTMCVGLMTFAEPLAPTMAELDLQVVMHAYCNQQSNMQDTCKALVDRFMHALYNALVAGIPPLGICEVVQICS
uniref:Saposin B-type domain-containing protein n=1 Tax=Plectus sambesii TaxID=2011161 RepID=A0A914WNW4_9BILA